MRITDTTPTDEKRSKQFVVRPFDDANMPQIEVARRYSYAKKQMESATINWPACGSVSSAYATKFGAALSAALHLAVLLNGDRYNDAIAFAERISLERVAPESGSKAIKESTESFLCQLCGKESRSGVWAVPVPGKTYNGCVCARCASLFPQFKAL